MRHFKKTFAWLSIVSVSAASLSAGPTFAAPQSSSPCTATNIVDRSCANAIWVGPERDKPFSADRTTVTYKSSEDEIHFWHQETDSVSRDTAGRIREESHRFFGNGSPNRGKLALGGIPSSHMDLNTSTTLVDDLSQLSISILDCFAGKRIQITAETQSAIVQKSCVERPTFQPNDHPYFDSVSQQIKANSQPNSTVEDLGYGNVEFFQARGIKIMSQGGQKDGEWEGKPVAVWEMWISDDLGATLEWDYRDLRKGTQTHTQLKNIRRGEPDPSLFVVPTGYKIETPK
jgi:hypothetical protein